MLSRVRRNSMSDFTIRDTFQKSCKKPCEAELFNGTINLELRDETEPFKDR